MFFLTVTQANDLLTRAGVLSTGESLAEQRWSVGAEHVFAGRASDQAVGRALADAMRDSVFTLAYVRGTGLAPEREDMNLYYGFRRSLQDFRSLLEGPVHLFEAEDLFHMRSVFFMFAAFRWDVSIMGADPTWRAEFTRDGALRFPSNGGPLQRTFEHYLTHGMGGEQRH